MPSNMSPDQRRCLDEAERVWPRYAALLRAQDDFVGGMQWKPVAGAEYLSRYRPDPTTGRKVAKSLGRRSPETEAAYADFLHRRDASRAELGDLEARLETTGRFARALGLNRMPAKQAEALRNLWRSGHLDEDNGVLVSGAAAVLLYESKARMSAKVETGRDDDGLAFLFTNGGRLTWERSMEFAIALGGRNARVETLADGSHWRRMSVDGVAVALFDKVAIDEALEDAHAPRDVEDYVDEMLRAPPISGFVFARDATVAPVRAPDPRAFCFVAPLMALGDDWVLDVAWARSTEVERITQESSTLPRFTPGMREALEDMRENLDPERAGADARP